MDRAVVKHCKRLRMPGVYAQASLKIADLLDGKMKQEIEVTALSSGKA